MIALAPAAVWSGAGSCRPCHEAKFASHQQTPHARALRRAEDSRLGELFRGSMATRGWRYGYDASGGELQVRVEGEGTAAMALEWAFGAGVQAVTPAWRSQGGWIEHRLSYYTGSKRVSLTPGHLGRVLTTAADAWGVPQDAATITRCFTCHATGVQPGPDLSTIEVGVAVRALPRAGRRAHRGGEGG
jgi:cytochrome c553